LHEVRVVLGQDDYTVRVGLRKLSIVDRKLCINNEPCFLQGVNRHEVHPDFGHAVPPELQLKDLQLIKQLGANFIRGSHYPQDPRLLDWCDELGLLVWNEAIGWQHRVEELVNPRFVQAQAAHISEMLAMSENHACVIMWGILNESASHQQLGRAAFEALFQHLRKLDPSRPVTFATCHPHDDLCLDLVDIVSVNTYPGWYVDSLEKVPAKLSELLQELRAKEPHKPILVSEIGAGALFGCHAREAPHWTEEYQAQLLDSVLDTLLTKAPDCAGICIWQFTDCRVSNAVPGVLGRPRGFNNKGLLDEYRRPKLAFETVMKWFGRPS
jgi:beta-glucuronidase